MISENFPTVGEGLHLGKALNPFAAMQVGKLLLLVGASHRLLVHVMPQRKDRSLLLLLSLIKPDSSYWAAVSWSLLLIANLYLKYSVLDPSQRSQMPGFLTSRRKPCTTNSAWCTSLAYNTKLPMQSPTTLLALQTLTWCTTRWHSSLWGLGQPTPVQPLWTLLPDWYLLQRACSILHYLCWHH